MNKYIGFDIDSKKIVACVVENGEKDIYETLKADIGAIRYRCLSSLRDRFSYRRKGNYGRLFTVNREMKYYSESRAIGYAKLKLVGTFGFFWRLRRLRP